jgi:hypothetical protein
MLTRSDHFDGQRFFNPTGPPMQPFTSLPRMLLARRIPWPARDDDAPQPLPGRDTAATVVTFIGHATFLIQAEVGNVLTDPMFSERAGPWNVFGPGRVRPPAIALNEAARVS